MKIFRLDRIISLAFGILVFLFFAFIYPFHLNYQEQYQLFLFSGEYFTGFLSKPGGISDYAGNFLTQFFFYSWIGAIIIATLLTFLQRVVWLLSKKTGANPVYIPLSFIPSLLYWSLLCDENYLLGGLMALLIVSCFIFILTLFDTPSRRIFYILLLITPLYWATGIASVLLPLYAIIYEIHEKKIKRRWLILFPLTSILFALSLPVICKLTFLQYPLLRAFTGVNYYRFPLNIPVTSGIAGILIVGTPLILSLLKRQIPRGRALLISIQLALLLVGGFFLISKSSDMKKEEVMAYDFYTRMRKWDNIVAMANKKTPSSPLSVACLNLALAKTGMLSDRMFSYFQNGTQGLLPGFVRDYTIPMIAGEIYYHLGLINTAQRYAFESMEALPDYQKSVRAIKRLAETAIINEQYPLAHKYLCLLQKTFYYRKWATMAINTIQDESKIEQHQEWGWLRQCRPDKDFLFSEGEKDMMLGILFTKNQHNRMAYEYLMAYCLLSKDLDHFIRYFPLGKAVGYLTVPRSYQEALAYIEGTTESRSPKVPAYPVSNQVISRFIHYKNIYLGQANASPTLKKQFSDTYWYYLHFRK